MLFIDSCHFIYWLRPFLLLIQAIFFIGSNHFIYCESFIDSNNLFIDSTHLIYWLESFCLLTRAILFITPAILFIELSHIIYWLESFYLLTQSHFIYWLESFYLLTSHFIIDYSCQGSTTTTPPNRKRKTLSCSPHVWQPTDVANMSAEQRLLPHQ